MSETTKIEWTDATFNPWIGCTKVSPACDNCYAEVSTPARSLRVSWGAKEDRHRTSAANWKLPLRWNAQHDEFFVAHGRRRRVFCASLADVFDNAISAQWRFDLLRLIVETPNLDWLLLTKRIGNAAEMLEQAMRALTIGREGWRDNYLPNVWLGATICDQEEADRDIPKLLAVPARVRFLSMEPLLGSVDLERHLWKCCGHPVPGHPGDGWMQPPDPPECCDDRVPADLLHWVIVGGESGTHARPMHPDWAKSLRDQCAAAGVPFLFKQWGGWTPGVNVGRVTGTVDTATHWAGSWDFGRENLAITDGHIDDEPDLYRISKKAAGRLLDGVQHDGFPGTE
ncbi:phage Gp37/Gp68 family protein [Cupriavidus sp. CV2]|uniref:phage Gp37/Gp68 family protein n=1 Tax=Cupriavidus ulmosensis TaxID=3065913 RepID=UPI00296AC5C8|nr:phage Gp37/Gp68 family protein [Cupriavidus sp. CV2]MDW3683051.1 phage Gp37/Gp68 family protein [Cupriavidus sp. CV2]